MRAAVVGAILGAVVFPAAAEQGEVTGAFGFEFGQVVDFAGLQPLGTEEEGGLKYTVVPDKPYEPLTEYVVSLTPASHRVYRITARGTFSSMKRCREELVQLEQALGRKYVKTSGRMAYGFGETPEITFGRSARRIRGVCIGALLNKTLTLTYVDDDLAQAARREIGPADGAAASQDGGGSSRDESGL
jgi:hypothetical protein